VLVRLLRKEEAAFDPDAIKAMTMAYDSVRDVLRLSNVDDPLTEIIAKHVIDLAKMGQLDPDRLRDLVLARMRL
jgi:hypothetical protein